MLGGLFDIDSKITKLNNINNELDKSYNNWSESQDIDAYNLLTKEKNDLEKTINLFCSINDDLNNIIEIDNVTTEDDSSLQEQIKEETIKLTKTIEKYKIECIFTDSDDNKSCFIELQSGLGGNDSNDFAMIMLRMYTRWAEIYHNYKTKIIDQSSGDEAGIKNAIIKIEGEKAFGWAKSEDGVHRVVRISPFNSAGKRQTSFVNVNVIPVNEKSLDLVIKPSDIKIETCKSSGAGGQHVNTTDSAVRIIHISTGLVVKCQNNRSQHKNKEEALSLLKYKINNLELNKQRMEQSKQYSQNEDIAWGNHIRSYILHPYKMVKDHRTNFSVPDVEDVLNGNLDPFIMKYITK